MEKNVPTTLLIESIRRLVIRASDVNCVKRLTTGIYRAAVRALVREIAVPGCTLSILSRNSYAAGTIVPGQSDIDMAIIIEDNLDPEAVKSYIRLLYTRTERLRSRFPMLDQFPVYTRRGFIMAYQLGPIRIETYAWQCEWGESDFLAEPHKPMDKQPFEDLSRCAQVYINGFHNNLRVALGANQTRSTLAMERSAKKLVRSFNSSELVGKIANRAPIAELIAQVLIATTKGLEQCGTDEAPHSWEIVGLGDISQSDIQYDTTAVKDGLTAIVSARNGMQPSCILSTPVTVSSVEDALNWKGPDNAGKDSKLILTESLFTFFLRFINPMLYYRLQAARNICGEDIFSHIQAPTQIGIRRYFSFEAAQLLKIPSHLGSSQPPKHQQLSGQERRRQRLFRFLQQDEILLGDDGPLVTQSESPGAVDLLDKILHDMPAILNTLDQHSTKLHMNNSNLQGNSL